VIGGGLALLQTGDRVHLDIANRRLDALVPDDEWAARRAAWTPPVLENQTPWQELYRSHVGQLAEGGCLEFATNYHRTSRQLPRDNH
jgi:dihydroxy-acid dehydratase